MKTKVKIDVSPNDEEVDFGWWVNHQRQTRLTPGQLKVVIDSKWPVAQSHYELDEWKKLGRSE